MKYGFGSIAVAVGLAVTPAIAAEAVTPEFGKVRPLTVRELNVNSAKYDGKIVRVQGVFAYGTDLYRLTMPHPRPKTEADRSPETRTRETECVNFENRSALAPTIHRRMPQTARNRHGPWHRTVTIVGLFTVDPTPEGYENVISQITGCDTETFLRVDSIKD